MIENGILVDVSATAKEAGIRLSTAFTAAVWHQYVVVPEACPWQDEQGRSGDILTMFRHTARGTDGSEMHFQVLVDNDGHGPKPSTLNGVCAPGDDAEPVITIMMPGED